MGQMMINAKEISMQELELALDDSLQMLDTGQHSLAQCLARHPECADELRPLLVAALRLRQGKSLRAPVQLRDRIRKELAEDVKSQPKTRKQRHLPKLVTGMLVLAGALMFATSVLAQGALPGQGLYNVKLSMQRVWRDTSPDPVTADLTLADWRSNDLVSLAMDDKVQRQDANLDKNAQQQGIAAYTEVLDSLASETDGRDGSLILTVLEHHATILSNAGINVPELDNLVATAHASKTKSKGSENGKGNGKNP